MTELWPSSIWFALNYHPQNSSSLSLTRAPRHTDTWCGGNLNNGYIRYIRFTLFHLKVKTESCCILELTVSESLNVTITFTFMHLADAFIQSDLHCIQVTVSTFFYQLLLSLGIEPMILALLTPCSTSWATGKLNERLINGWNVGVQVFK